VSVVGESTARNVKMVYFAVTTRSKEKDTKMTKPYILSVFTRYENEGNIIFLFRTKWVNKYSSRNEKS